VRAAGDPAALSSAARAAVRAVDATQPVYDVMTLRAALGERTLGLQYIAVVMGVLGALGPRAGGRRRLRRHGLHGRAARPRDWRQDRARRDEGGRDEADRSHTRCGSPPSASALGIALSVLLGRVIEWGLLGTASVDARIVAALGRGAVLSALAAGYIPARRAASIDPICTLRGEIATSQKKGGGS
jgi:hypothetical protein